MPTQTLATTRLEGSTDLFFGSSSSLSIVAVSESARTLLVRMFRDPYALEPAERVELIEQLRTSLSAEQGVSGLHVLLGMALCVNLDVQSGLDELRLAVDLAPDSFIARLKLGELLMRLRICSEAAEQTHAAALLAGSPLESELARKQAAAIRTMQREGIERGGYGKLRAAFQRAGRRVQRSGRKPSLRAFPSR